MMGLRPFPFLFMVCRVWEDMSKPGILMMFWCLAGAVWVGWACLKALMREGITEGALGGMKEFESDMKPFITVTATEVVGTMPGGVLLSTAVSALGMWMFGIMFTFLSRKPGGPEVWLI